MISLTHIHRIFLLGQQEVRGLDDVSLHIGAGDYVSVMGPSGSGKSTLLNVLGLLDLPDAGEYRLAGTLTTRLNEEARAALRRQHIGFVFQSYQLIARLSAWENTELPLVLAGVAPDQRRQAVDQVLEQLGMSERRKHLPNQLSGGQRQRVAIARAMVGQPSVLLADEPTGNLDSQAGQGVIAALEQLNADGVTLIVVTHDPELARRAPRCLHMRDGRIASDHPPGERDHENSGSAAL